MENLRLMSAIELDLEHEKIELDGMTRIRRI
jgi:hypothetical protein